MGITSFTPLMNPTKKLGLSSSNDTATASTPVPLSDYGFNDLSKKSKKGPQIIRITEHSSSESSTSRDRGAPTEAKAPI